MNDTQEIPTLEVPADIYDEALRFVNSRRAERDLNSVAELPPGEPQEPTSCPCANSCGADIYVGSLDWNWGKKSSLANLTSTGHPKYFVRFFDENAPKEVGPVLPIRKVTP